jgi:TP901 family phage tail tape measure protein
MATTEKYTTVIELNSEQAKRNLDELRRKVKEWESDLEEAKNKKMGRSFIADIRKELRDAKKDLRKYDSEVARTIDTLNNIGTASVEQIENAQKSLLRLSMEVPYDSESYKNLTAMLDQVTQELENIKATKAFEQMQHEADGTARSASMLKAEMDFIKQTAENAGTASVRQLQLAERTAENIKHTSKQGSDEWNKASAHLKTIKDRLSEIEESEKKNVTLIDRYNAELKKVDQAAKQVVSEQQLIDRTMKNLSTASVRDIEYSIKALNEQLHDIDRNDPKVKEITQRLKELNAELRKVQDMQKPDESKGNIFTRGMDFLNKNWGAITQVIGGYDMVRDVVKGSVEAFAQMDQEMNNVRKYTGQSIEEVERMNEAFKKMDTRTPREQLNQLAGSAGRLGITSTAAVTEFVDAADKINVALGDDLGKGAVDAIGKLAMAFGEDETKGMRGAMLATGSAVNELAQNSAAGAGYLVDFAARLSGIGIQAGMTQAQILGLGAAMDENMQKDEMAATALSQIITKMTTDSETFARIAGKNVEEFAQLVKTDMNQALMQFFEAMNRKGGFTELAPLFEQMGLDGTRAIGVLSTLSSKIDDVRRHQELATAAYKKGTSVIDEFNVQNDTYQAKLEKARKAFGDLRIELGEKLLPVASTTISTTTVMVRILSTIINFALKFRAAIVSVTVAIGLLTAVKYKDVAVTKLQNFWNVTLLGSMKRLYAAVMANPWAAATVAVAALVGLIADLTRRSNEATVAQKAMASVEHDATVKAELERQKIEELRKHIHDNNLELSERRRYIEELQKIVPDYVAKISKEGRVYEESTEALDKYIQKIKEKAMVDGAKAKMEELAAERAELVAERIRKNEEIRQRREEESERLRNRANRPQTTSGSVPAASVFENVGASAEIAAMEASRARIDRRLEETDKAIELMGTVAKNAAETVKKAATGSKNTGKSFDTRSFWEQELKERRAKLKALREDANATAADVEKASKAVKEAEDKMEIFTGAKARAKAERDRDKAMDKARHDRERKANDAAKAETEQQLADLTHRYAMGRIMYCDYVEEQERIQLEGIERRMLIYRTESLEYQKLNRQREELLLNGTKESHQLMETEIRVAHEQRMADIQEQAWRESHTEQWKNEQLFLEDMRFMDEQRILYRQGTIERINLERDIEERQQQHRLQQQQYYQQQLEQAREQLLQMDSDRRLQLELQNINEVYDYMIRQGIAKETERQEAILAIKAKYAGYQTTTERDQEKGSQMLAVASDQAKRATDGSSNATLPFIGTIVQYKATMEKLKELYGSDEQNHAAYLAAKQQATAQFCQELAAQMQAAYNTVNQVVQAAGSYFQAQQEYETAQVKRKYEKQIEAAGNNQKKVKKLQEQQQKEEAAIKTKYARRAAAIQMAQAVAQTAISAINAYSSAAAIPVTGYILAPIAAAAALAAGMLQIATIKKQQQAQQAGYYEGGFTGGRQYRREAGVVHEGEFVANHQAVQNPAILPFLNFLDQAQRNNTVGSLSMQDVSRSMGAGATQQVVAPIVSVQTDNSELKDTLRQAGEAIDRLAGQIEMGIGVDVPIDGENGLYRRLRRYEKLLKIK